MTPPPENVKLSTVIKQFIETVPSEEKSLVIFPYRKRLDLDLTFETYKNLKFLYSQKANYVFGFWIAKTSLAKKLHANLHAELIYLNTVVSSDKTYPERDQKIPKINYEDLIYLTDICTKLKLIVQSDDYYFTDFSFYPPYVPPVVSINEITFLDAISFV